MSAATSSLVGEDPQTWQEQLQADDATIRARAWNADLFAAFRTARACYAREYGKRLREVYGDEWAKVVTQSFEVYAALLDAAESDEGEVVRTASVRRFPLKAYRAGEFLSCKLLPYIEDAAEFQRRRSALERLWSRSGWRWVDMLQKVTGDALFSCDTPGFDGNKGNGDCTYYIDRLNDLLAETIRRARRSRSRRRVQRFETAWRGALRSFKDGGRIPAYAPEWKPPEKVSDEERHERAAVRLYRAAPLAFCIVVAAVEESKRPEVKAREMIRRALLRAFSELGNDEAAKDALQVEAHALLDEIREGEGESAPPACSPCVSTADSGLDAGELVARASEGSCDFSAESDESAPDVADANVRRTPPAEVLEFDPEPEPRGVSMAEAEAALTACASVGLERLLAVFLDDTIEDFKESCTFSEHGNPKQFRARLEGYLERNLNRRESLSVRFRFKDDFSVIQCDDCPPEALAALAPFSFLRFATSPGNAQVLLAVSDELTKKEYDVLKYRLFNITTSPLGKLGVNAGGNGSARWPGSINHKPKRKYADGESPRVQLLGVALGRFVNVAQLEAAGLLGPAPTEPKPADVRAMRGRLPRGWPDIETFYAKYENDRSRAEIAWAMRAGAMGWSEARVAAQLGQIGAKAATRDRDGYVTATVRKAFEWLGLGG
jgi:hypothetical protein